MHLFWTPRGPVVLRRGSYLYWSVSWAAEKLLTWHISLRITACWPYISPWFHLLFKHWKKILIQYLPATLTALLLRVKPGYSTSTAHSRCSVNAFVVFPIYGIPKTLHEDLADREIRWNGVFLFVWFSLTGTKVIAISLPYYKASRLKQQIYREACS